MELYIGVVIDNDDPDKTGKVRVRIPEINGTNGSDLEEDDDLLEWFEPCTPFFGGYQYGSFVVPPVGAIVWCVISEVDSGNPYQLYIGGCYGTGTLYGKKLGEKSVPKKKLETPEEAIDDYPNTSVLFKSLSGSVIMVDSDGVISLTNSSGSSVEVGEDSVKLNTTGASIEIRGDNKIIISGDIELASKINSDVETTGN